MAAKKYDNDSIKALKGAEKVRKRPGVIFGSDDIEGAKHSCFEIISNSIDEAKDGFGDVIEVIKHKDQSISVRDYGRGIPLDYNKQEERYNWELVYCELYAGGKYDEGGDNYEFSLGLNGLGACATQYSSEFFDVEVIRDGYQYNLHFEKGENIGGLTKKKLKGKHPTGTYQHWKPDIDVFTEVDIPVEYFVEILKKQAIVNKEITFKFLDEETGQEEVFLYENGILDYLNELNNEKGLTTPYIFSGEAKGKDREDKPEYKVKVDVAFCFNNNTNSIEYYHNSSWLEHGGAPDKAARKAFVDVMDKILKQKGKYNKNESKVTFNDIEDSLILITNSFSTQTSYENQTKKAINNKFIQDYMTTLMKEQLEIWFIENEMDGNRIIDQVLANKRSREQADKQRQILKKQLSGSSDSWDKVKKFVDCKSKNPEERELFIVEGE